MKILQSWRYSRPFMTTFVNEDISLHVPKSGLIGVKTNKKTHAIDLLQFYQQNYQAQIIDLNSLSEVSTQRKLQLIDAVPLEDQNLDLTSDDAIKNMQIEYEKQGTTFVFGYPNTVDDAKKIENYCGGLNLFLNLKFSSDFDNVEVKNQYLIDEDGKVYNKTFYQETLQKMDLQIEDFQDIQESKEDIKMNQILFEQFQEMVELPSNQVVPQLKKSDQKLEESILDFYDRRGLLIDMNIERSHDISNILFQLTEKMVRMFKY